MGHAAIHVIGWGTWAAFEQRELCDGISESYHFMVDLWDVPEQAADFRRQSDDAFWELRLFPLVRRQMSSEKDYYHHAQDDAMALVRRKPECVPAGAWDDISDAPRGLERYFPPPHPFINEWHRVNPQPGTAYDLGPRFIQPSFINRRDFVVQLERLHSIAPYDTLIDYQLIYAKYSIYPPPEVIEKIYGDKVEYLASPCVWIASQSTDKPGEYEKWMERAATLAPIYRRILAIHLASQGEDSKAEASFQRWLSNETDDVLIANSVEWLIEYKERTGASQDATAPATKAYDSGSSTGMAAMAHLLEIRKEYERAYGIYAVIRERYNESAQMVGFLMRMKKIGSASRRDELLASLMQSDFPSGLVPEDLRARGEKPSRGARVENPYDETAITGLRWKDVIVALNGYAVIDPGTFSLIRAIDPAAPLSITIWRDNKYISLAPCAGKYVYVRPYLQ